MRALLFAAIVAWAITASVRAEYIPGTGALPPPDVTYYGSGRYIPPTNVPTSRVYPEPAPSHNPDVPQRQLAPASPDAASPSGSGGGASYGSGYDRLDPRQRTDRP